MGWWCLNGEACEVPTCSFSKHRWIRQFERVHSIAEQNCLNQTPFWEMEQKEKARLGKRKNKWSCACQRLSGQQQRKRRKIVQGWHGMWSVGAASCLWSGGPRARGGDGLTVRVGTGSTRRVDQYRRPGPRHPPPDPRRWTRQRSTSLHKHNRTDGCCCFCWLCRRVYQPAPRCVLCVCCCSCCWYGT
jgi:hypothetical protein